MLRVDGTNGLGHAIHDGYVKLLQWRRGFDHMAHGFPLGITSDLAEQLSHSRRGLQRVGSAATVLDLDQALSQCFPSGFSLYLP